MAKHPRYQDHVIADGKLVGDFEGMYRDFDDPWGQTMREEFASEKAVALNLRAQLKAYHGCQRVLELSCGFAARAAGVGLDATGIDISETAVQKAKTRHPGTLTGAISDQELFVPSAPTLS